MSNEKWGIGDKANAESFDTTLLGRDEVELVFGDYPHSRSDNRQYARTKSGTIYDFDGHRRLIDVKIESNNYLKESGLSGDQIRKEVLIKIYSDRHQIYESFARDPRSALLRAYHLIDQLEGVGALKGWISAEGRKKMVGQKIYYYNVPATITRTIDNQGAVIIATEPGVKLPHLPYDEEDSDSWDEWKEGDHYEVKEDVLSPHIWWYRS